MSIDEQIKILRQEIAPLRKRLSQLVAKRKELNSERVRQLRSLKQDADLEIFHKQLLLAAEGMSASKIAETIGCTKHNAAWKIELAWRHFYPNHYENSRWIRRWGVLTALRMSERPFDCPLRKEFYVPPEMQEEFEYQKKCFEHISFATRKPQEEDGDKYGNVECVYNGQWTTRNWKSCSEHNCHEWRPIPPSDLFVFEKYFEQK